MVMLLLIAFMAMRSRPDAESFQRHMVRHSGQATGKSFANAIGRSMTVAAMSTIDHEYIDYGFFSVVRFPEQQATFIGIAGAWFRLGLGGANHTTPESDERDHQLPMTQSHTHSSQPHSVDVSS